MADGTPNEATPETDRPDHRLQFSWRRRLPMIQQTEAGECALACLAMVASYYGYDVNLSGLRRRFSTSLKGATLSQIIRMAGQLNLASRPLRLDLNELAQLRTPCVLHWNLNHFVVLKRANRGGVVIHDPARGVRKITAKQASEHFTGVALELMPSANFAPQRQRQAISLREITGQVRGLMAVMAQILVMASALEVFALASPFYLQWVIDQVLVSADRDLLTLLGVGFLGITLLSALVAAARSWTVTYLSATLSVQWTSNIINHLMRLPLEWFEKRHVGDVVSRFGSMQTIQRTLTTQFIEASLDGLMSLATLFILISYSSTLAALVAVLIIIYGLFRGIFFSPLRQAGEEQIVYSAKQQSELLESVRGAMPIKLANKQRERSVRFVNALVESLNSAISVQRLGIIFSFINQVLFGAGRILLVWAAAIMAMKGKFSAGMLIAFIAYADQFIGRAAALVDHFIDFRMLRLHAERVADIALSEPESSLQSNWSGSLVDTSLEFVRVSFRYAENEPWVLKDCSFHIESGESVALTGPSGCGKTTIAKLILGLLTPCEGEVRLGGVDIRNIGLEKYRSLIGAVMQDDQLFAGSISENISFFCQNADRTRVKLAAMMAAIHDDIEAMPMGYETLVGDMGSVLSGGQKQRVILARALYRRPKLLVLDESTSHLDIAREKRINAVIKKMSVSRFIIAHRPETISGAQRVFSMNGAGVVELPN